MTPSPRSRRRDRRAQQAASRRPRTRVGVGEVVADVAQAGRAEQRVDDRVRQHVGVGVPGQALSCGIRRRRG